MQLSLDYLAARGITEDTVKLYGIELDDLISHETAKDRLGQHLPKGTIEVIWFPICDAAGKVVNWIARPLPTIAGHPKFLCPLGSSGLPFIPKEVYSASFGRSLIITEGVVKTLVIMQAGYDAIGVNGVWGAGTKNSRDAVVIRAELYSALDWRGRKVAIAFDADCAINPDVRQAMIRLYFLLASVGAEVYQLTWDISQGRGIDDYLIGQFQSNGQHKPQNVLQRLLAQAKPFIETLAPTPLDLALCKSEWLKVEIPDILRSQLARPLAAQLRISVDELRKITSSVKARTGDFIDPEPWPYPISGKMLLDDLAGLVDKHIVVDDHGKVAIALWTVLAYLVDVVNIMPNLAITSPEKRCGKSTLLELLMRLVRRPMPGVMLSPATVFRAIEKWHPTLLVDEADGLLKNARGDDNIELRSVINSGHTRAFAFVPRCEGDNHEVRNFSTWSPKAIALIGRMPDSMADRSIHIEMKRKAKTDLIAKLRETAPGVFEELRQKICRFVIDNSDAIKGVTPSFPSGLNDRAEDNWSPLFAIAEVAGGNWKDLAWKAAVALSGDHDSTDNFKTILLRALKQDFEDEKQNHDKGMLFTSDICSHLNADDEAPWQCYKNQMTPELLARRLRDHKIKSERIIIDGIRHRGLHWRDLKPVFDRYL
jgi:Protein of unknown function (DUF3631)/Domain of unknown function (DUF3854)